LKVFDLADGSSVVGRVVTEGADSYVLKTADGKTVEVRVQEIVGVRMVDEHASSTGGQPSSELPKLTDLPQVFVEAGSFQLGCDPRHDEVDFVDADGSTWTKWCRKDEQPAHHITLTHGFWMTKSEITQGQYSAFRSNPSHFSSCGEYCPVEQVSWADAMDFADALSKAHGLPTCARDQNPYFCKGWRLPTEAEWEFAARGSTRYPFAGDSRVDAVAWYSLNSGGKPHAVCGKQPNGYGLCDLTGNVWEWVWDAYGPYDSERQVDPFVKPTSSASGIARGGSWANDSDVLGVSVRSPGDPATQDQRLGFRLVRTGP